MASVAAAHPHDKEEDPGPDAGVWYATSFYHASEVLQYAEDRDALLEAAWNYPIGHSDDFDVDKAEAAVARFDAAIEWARRGSRFSRCTWAIDVEADGPHAVMPHLSQMRRISRLLATRAAVLRERGDLAGSTGDLLVIMRMARHTASDQLLISVLVQYSIDQIAILSLTNQLDRYDRPALIALQAALQNLDPTINVGQAIMGELVLVHWFRGILERDGIDRLRQTLAGLTGVAVSDRNMPDSAEQAGRLLNAAEKYYVQAAKSAALPSAELTQRDQPLGPMALELQNPIVKILLPDFDSARRVQTRHETKRAMLDAMIVYRLHGQEGFERIKDPVSGEPFEREVTDQGVVLRSRLQFQDKPFTVTFPPGCARPLSD